jgi:hypothetical protein
VQPRDTLKTTLGAVDIRMDFLLPRWRNGFEMAPRAAERAALMKTSLIGPWTIWLAMGIALLLPFAAAWVVAREPRE